ARAQARPPLYVMADSVVLGTDGALRRAMPDYQINMAGFPAIFTRVAADVIREEAWRVGDVAVVAIGHNYPYWDPARFDRALDAVVHNLAAAGAEHVIWVTLRHATHANSPPSAWWQVDRYAWYYPTVNGHLRRALDRHPQLSLADWAAISSGTGLTYDSIHLNTRGQAAMADLIRRSVDAARRRSPVGTTLSLPVRADPLVPDDARGVAVQVSLTNARRDGHADVFACGRSPATGQRIRVSSSTPADHQVFVRLSSTGAVCVRLGESMQASAQVLSYAPTGSPVGNPAQTLVSDITVGPGQVRTVDLPPSGRRGAAVVEVDARAHAGSATYTVYPCDQQPLWGTPLRTSTSGRVSHAVVRPSRTGQLCLQSRKPITASIDLVGSIANQAQLRARRPARLLRVPANEPLAARQRATLDPGAHPGVPDGLSHLSIYLRITAAFTAGELEIANCARPAANLRGWRYRGVGATTVVHVPAGANGRLCVRSSQPVAFDAFAVGWADKKPVLASPPGRPAVATRT
ncbi:MAG: hypothetical protein OES57_09820, partial [Acidimicrobiia bacterium]|nr:hypothetical protein [Acidimicrobiia bacterium]